MKRLNKKGFTLVELLAVIVILAIVVGITLVTVLPTLKKSRQEAFELTAQTAADYFEKQYQLYLIGEDIPATVKAKIESAVSGGTGAQIQIFGTELSYAGLKPENYVYGHIQVNTSTGRVCVNLSASTNTTKRAGIYNLAGKNEAGEYYDATEGSNTTFAVYKDENLETLVGSTTTYSIANSSGC